MQIGNVKIIGDAFLAPIAGFTDVGFRDVVKKYGCSLTYTEMVSCKGIVYGSEKTKELLSTSDLEVPKAVQIFGCEPKIMRKAITTGVFDKFDIIDINMGCPVPKIVNNGEGSALMENPHLAQKVVAAVKDASGDKAVTVKTRLGFNKKTIVDFAKYLQDAGADAITVHGRTRTQFYAGSADWEEIARVVEAVDIPIIANGDVHNLDSYLDIKAKTNAAAVMIARGALGNPSIFKDIAQYNALNIVIKNGDVDIKRDILNQIEQVSKFYDDHYVYSNMKKHICYYVKGMANSRAIKDKVCRAESIDELLSSIYEVFGEKND